MCETFTRAKSLFGFVFLISQYTSPSFCLVYHLLPSVPQRSSVVCHIDHSCLQSHDRLFDLIHIRSTYVTITLFSKMDTLFLNLSVLGWMIFTFVPPTAGQPLAGTIIANNTYDYLIAGCGTSGLTAATRLTEQNFTVLCIEAGQLYDISHPLP